MRNLVAIPFLAILAVPSVGLAASPLSTAPLPFEPGEIVQCAVSNVGTKPVELRVEIVRDVGTPIIFTLTSEPGAISPVGVNWLSGSQAYCQVSGISKKNARVRLCVLDGTGHCGPTVEGH